MEREEEVRVSAQTLHNSLVVGQNFAANSSKPLTTTFKIFSKTAVPSSKTQMNETQLLKTGMEKFHNPYWTMNLP